MDADGLTPAPWLPMEGSAGLKRADGSALAHFYQGSTTETEAQALRDRDFAALSRAAFDVMLRRKWAPRPAAGGWCVVARPNNLVLCKVNQVLTADDPFTALVEADRWYRENVERAEKGGAG